MNLKVRMEALVYCKLAKNTVNGIITRFIQNIHHHNWDDYIEIIASIWTKDIKLLRLEQILLLEISRKDIQYQDFLH